MMPTTLLHLAYAYLRLCNQLMYRVRDAGTFFDAFAMK